MGVLCSKMAVVDRSPSEITLQNFAISYEFNEKERGVAKATIVEQTNIEFSDDPYLGFLDAGAGKPKLSRVSSQKSKTTGEKPTATDKLGAPKASEVSSLLGRVGTASLGKAVSILDVVGSSMTNLNSGSGFGSGMTMKGCKISILSFEVANTIVKGANLLQSLSKENIKYLKEVVLPSEGVQCLVSTDMNELLRIAAADKREELKVFSSEIVRFGNRCKDPQWHNLEHYFAKLETELAPQQQLKEIAKQEMDCLMTLVEYTAELYHEFHALDKFEQDYKQKRQEEKNLIPSQRGDSAHILKQELKSQRKQVDSLKKKSLWSKVLEEVMAKLVDIIHFLHLEIHEAFGSADEDEPGESISNHQRLGPASLALHYANVITRIDTLVSRSSSVPPNIRDALYQSLPPNVKSALRSKLQSFQVEKGLTVPHIKAQMEKTLRWLVPVANNTTRAHHGFGWVGEWANSGMETNWKHTGHTQLIKIETLYHADKAKTEAYILDLVVWLHHLINLSRPGSIVPLGSRSPSKSPVLSNNKNRPSVFSPVNKPTPCNLTGEEQAILQDVNSRRITLGRSRSQEFDAGRGRLRKHDRLSKSCSHSPVSVNELSVMRQQSVAPAIDFDIDRIKVLDIIDRVHNLTNLLL